MHKDLRGLILLLHTNQVHVWIIICKVPTGQEPAGEAASCSENVKIHLQWSHLQLIRVRFARLGYAS